MVINAGIEKVYIRDTKDLYRIIEVTEWINHDESLEGTFGY
jgi:dCMP deaminase